MKNSVYFPFSQSFIAGNGGNTNQSHLPGLIYSQSDDEVRAAQQMLQNNDYRALNNTSMLT